MTELSIQRNSPLAGAYVSTAAATPVTTASPVVQPATNNDSVFISPEAQKLFEQSITDTPISADLPVVTPSNGDGIRPPDAPPTPPVKV